MIPPPPPPPPSASGGVKVELTSLRLMKEKGIISQAEFDSAVHDLVDTSGTKAGDTTVAVGKFATTIYGFVEADSIFDSTRALNDAPGAAIISAPKTFAGDNSRVTFGIRNSRLGFRMKAPELAGIRASGLFEFDFLGTQLTPATGATTLSPSPYGTEGALFSNSVARLRHLYVKVETPVVDILFGQTWALFGWGSAYQPNTIEIQGMPGELFFRTPQFRLSKTIKADAVSLELALAAVRPVQRDSGTPDGQAGIKFNVDAWKGAQTAGAAGSQISPLSLAVSGLLRHVAVNDFNKPASDTSTQDLTMSAIAVDAFVPVVPATKEHKDNAFSLQGEFTSGYGDADHFSSFTGGVGFPNTTAGTPYAADIDPGIVTFDGNGKLHAIQWTTYLFGAQYMLPGVDGKLLLSGNYSHMESANSHFYTFGAANAAKVLHAEDWFDVNFSYDPVPGVRFGLEYANFNDSMVSGLRAINHRGQFSGFFIF